VAKPKKPVSSSGAKTPPKTPAATAKTDVKAPAVAAKSAADVKPAVASSGDKTTTSSASKASVAVKAASKTEAMTEKPALDAPKAPDTKPEAKTTPDKLAVESTGTAKAPEKPAVSSSEPAKVAPKTEAPAPRPAPTPEPQKSGGFVPLVFGGVIAAVIGFAASEANFMGWRTQDNSLRDAIAAQDEKIAALIVPVAEQAPDLSGIETALETLRDQAAALDARLTEVENRPAPAATVQVDGAPVEDVRADLAQMQAALETQQAEIETLLGNAKSIEEATAVSARAAAGQRALAQVTAAISNGGGYADAIAAMTEAGITDLPAALTGPAADGVATLINLQTRFPDLARAALTDARAAATDTEETGVGGFLRRQLGARSVIPREGSDLDAVLSRAEAAVRDGRVADALREIDALPQGAKDAMQSWSADAKVRADAEAAVQDLSQRLTAN
jgi:hypothetical protein